MSGQIYLDDLENFELAVFNSKSGVAASYEDRVLVTFRRISGEWSALKIDLSDVSGVENITVTPEKLLSTGGRNLNDSGAALGSALRNSIHKNKANGQTGIKIHIRSLNTPSVFLNMPNEHQRTSTFEGLNQFLSGEEVSGKMQLIPPQVQKELTRPTETEVKKRNARNMALRLSLKSVLALLMLSLLATTATLTYLWSIGKLYSGNSLRNTIDGLFGETLAVLFVWFVALYLLNSTRRYLKA